jgi:hypothetical protein
MRCSKCNTDTSDTILMSNCHVDKNALTGMSLAMENFLDQSYHTVICTSCIQEIERKFIEAETAHEFYFEGNNLVFSYHYHLKRGYCCRSKCRHCPYGYEQSLVASQ